MRLAGTIRAAAAIAMGLAVSTGAHATLLDVLEGTSQTIGDLTFTFTDVSQVGGVNLQEIDLTLVADGLGIGFDVTPVVAGALTASDGGIKDIKLEFTVTSTLGIDRAGNHLVGSAIGEFSSASVSELIDQAPGVDLGVFVSGSGFELLDAVASLGGTFTTLTITKNLVIYGDNPGSATIDRLSQRYHVVPEPATAGLMVLGLVGLAHAGRRR